MQRTVKLVLALAIVASLVLGLVPVAMSADGQRAGGSNRTWSPPVEAYMVISAKNVTPDVAYFDVTSHAVRMADGKAVSRDFTVPLAGQYYFGNDTAIIKMNKPSKAKVMWDNKTRHRPGSRLGGPGGEGGRRPAMVDYGNATLNVAGTSAVVAMKDLSKAGDNRTLQFSNMNVYLPNGSLSAYRLSTPVTTSMHNRTMTFVGNPETGAIMRGLFASTDRFPANAGPVRLTDIDAK